MSPSIQVFLEPDEPRVLAIPYRTPGDPDRCFRNLKAAPELSAHVRELRDCPELRAFVTWANARARRFATLGCAHWIKADRDPPGLGREAGLYVDLVFDRLELASRRRCLEFVDRLRRKTARLRSGSADGFTIIRIQLQRVAFTKLAREAWLMSTWIFGAGATDPVAVARRRRGIAELAALCARVSREIDADRGTGGTPIPP